LDRLLSDKLYSKRAAEAARVVAQENAIGAACDAIDECLG
jgi:hypothetical protein